MIGIESSLLCSLLQLAARLPGKKESDTDTDAEQDSASSKAKLSKAHRSISVARTKTARAEGKTELEIMICRVWYRELLSWRKSRCDTSDSSRAIVSSAGIWRRSYVTEPCFASRVKYPIC